MYSAGKVGGVIVSEQEGCIAMRGMKVMVMLGG